MALTKENKTEVVLSSVLLTILFLFGILGTFFLVETIYLFLVESSVQADANLLNKIIRYFSFYKVFTISIMVVSVISIFINIYLLWKAKKYKLGYFIICSNIVTLFLPIIFNHRVMGLMNAAKAQMKQVEDISTLMVQGKDFVSVMAVATQDTIAHVTQTVLKGLAVEIFALVIFLFVFIILLLRTLELRHASEA